MTVGSQVKQTVAALKGAKATMDIYAAQSTSEQEKEVFQRNSQKVQAVIDSLEARIGTLEWEEPQYKGF